jgi:hypothetical protein
MFSTAGRVFAGIFMHVSSYEGISGGVVDEAVAVLNVAFYVRRRLQFASPRSNTKRRFGCGTILASLMWVRTRSRCLPL